jgi:LysM repeat protein
MIKYGRLIPVMAVLVLASCKSKKVITTKSSSKQYTTKRTVPSIGKESIKEVKSVAEPKGVSTTVTNKIIRKALSFKGTRYKYGGTTKSGMDCSGLMYSSFKSANVVLPRTSLEQSKKGVLVSKNNIQKGDLVFFKTNGKRRINHVGLVVSVEGRDIKFVHSSSSRGVMISSLKEGYWSNAYSQVRRLIGIQSIKEEDEIVSHTKTTYVVKKGDTLYAIARKYTGVSVADIMSYNNLKSTSLNLGMKLLIPRNK